MTMLRSMVGGTALVALFLVSPAWGQDDDALRRAYELEREALQQEKASLEAEIERSGHDHDEERIRLQSSIGDKRVRLTGLQVEADREEDRLADLESTRAGASSVDELLAVTLEQALFTLQRYGKQVEGSSELPDAELLEVLLEQGNSVLRERGSIRVDQGSFFLTDGREVSGDIVRLGEVAALGLAGEHGGVLVPGGGHALRVERDDPEALRSYLGGDGLSMTDVYLFDPVTRDEASRLQPGLWEKVLSGGPLVWPILALGLLAALIIAERLWTLRRLHSRTDVLLDGVLSHVRQGQWHAAADRCGGGRGAPRRILLAGLRNRHLEKQLLDDALSEAIVREMPVLERFLPILSVIAAVAPLLGLLGTVTGMISTFEVITEHGTGDPQMLSGGISVALVTTQLGLAVAIPVLLAQNLLSGVVEHLVGDMYKGGLTLSNAIHQFHCPRLENGTCVSQKQDPRRCPHLREPGQASGAER